MEFRVDGKIPELEPRLLYGDTQAEMMFTKSNLRCCWMRDRIWLGIALFMSLSAVFVHSYFSFRELTRTGAIICSAIAVLAFGLLLFLLRIGSLRQSNFLRITACVGIAIAMVMYINLEMDALLVRPGSLNSNLLLTIPLFHLLASVVLVCGVRLVTRSRGL